jgi:hypothetical protein
MLSRFYEFKENDRYWFLIGKDFPFTEFRVIDRENGRIITFFLVPIKC